MILSGVIGILAASLCYFLNSRLLRYWGNGYLVTLGPLLEEISKSWLAYELGAALLFTHLAFGIIEGSYEYFYDKNGQRSAGLSVIIHSLFGLVTTVLWQKTASFWVAVGIVVLLHAAYNLWVVFYFSRPEDR